MLDTLRSQVSLMQDYLRARLDITDETGATAVEYGLLVGAIALMLGTAATALSGEIRTRLEGILP